MARMGISVGAVALAGAGAVTVWAAMKGVGLASGVRTVLAGHALPAGEDPTITVDGSPSLSGGVEGPASDVAAAAIRYVGAGHAYQYGGGNPAGWDCSGFTNWVLCHDLGLAIPGY